MTTATAIEAWHFLADDKRLQFTHNGERGVLVEVGQTLTLPVSARRPLRLCEYGLHAAVRPLDALNYAPGAVVCRVRLSGEILAPNGEDKLCASDRTVLAMADATAVLHEFACWVGEEALERERAAGREPDPRSWAAIAAKRAWLRGEITSEQLAAASAAVRAAAAVRDAAWAAAWAAAAAAAWAAVRDAASAAAAAAASAAVRAAASAAAATAVRDAAWAAAAASAAARDAAWYEINAELERRLVALLEQGAAA